MKRLIFLLTVSFWAMAGFAARAQDVAGSSDLQRALENNRTNQSSTWVNPDNGSSGTVVPLHTFQNEQGEPCREFQQTIMIGGKEEQGYGTACRQPDGTWRIIAGEAEVMPPAPVEKHTTVYVREPGRLSYYYDPYGYYAPWGYRYPYWYPFGFSFGYVYRDGGHHHGGHHDGYYGGSHYRNAYGGGHYRGGHRR